MVSGSGFSAAILAGGRAARFGGREKGALMVGGRSILERQIEALAQVADEVLLVGGAGPPDRSGVRYVADLLPGGGPLSGLHTALTEAHGRATLVVACDMPYLTAALCRYLLALTDAADLVVPRTEDGYHPLCAAYTRACLGPVSRRLAQGHFKLTDLFGDLRVRVVAPDTLAQFGAPGQLLANVNTPDDYRSIGADEV
jgi:molybdopterin-guanine dinucleotide biosynthesis protein A